MTSLRLGCAMVLVLTPVLAGCGGSEPAGRSLLRDDTAAVVAAFNAKDHTAARRALQVLDNDIAAAARLKQLTAQEAQDLRARVTRLRSDLDLVAPKPSPRPSPTLVVTRPRTSPPQDDDEGKRKGRGKDDDD